MISLVLRYSSMVRCMSSVVTGPGWAPAPSC